MWVRTGSRSGCTRTGALHAGWEHANDDPPAAVSADDCARRGRTSPTRTARVRRLPRRVHGRSVRPLASRILEAIREALAEGIVLGAPNRYETMLAEAVVARFPAIDLVRFCNSGTEANLLALSLSRGQRTLRRPRLRRCVPRRDPSVRAWHLSAEPAVRWIVGEYNDAPGRRGCRRACARSRRRIVEPLQGAAGDPGRRGVPASLREATADHGVLLSSTR